ncbi:carbon-nitrogen hydrolase [Halteromyces radiatus]|uniref:carbon-nitrogen hydrolase n=1 Tax=Halteromyces radiatus TaxID=101107 RepID=UPI00221E4C82|nr:carbon-nitrogen hydrolase [Halteromyces radiatus]KAI8082886.1 carbon-nitrogen hydrolase [Halteromyces radiatus]
MSTIRVSVAQVGTPKFELEPTMAKLESYVKQAREQNSRLVVFPEAFIGGYPKHSTFGMVIGARSPEGRQEYARYHKGAIVVPGPVTDRLVTLSKENDIFLVVGVIEREELTGSLYCTVVYIDPDQGYVGKHRKLMPTSTERTIWSGIADGSTLPVVANRDGHRISAVICWENYMPLLRSFMYSQGVQLYCAPTVDHRDVWQSTMQHVALEGRCFVLSACQFTRQKDYPEGHAGNDLDGGDPEAPRSLGGSVIISPLGTILAGPLRGDEGLLTADLDMEEIIQSKLDLDPAGHYTRPDVFKLIVNQTSNSSA